MLQPVGVFAIAPVGRAARRLDLGSLPVVRPQRAQGCRREKGARPHLKVIGLQDHAAPLAPVMLKREDQILTTKRLRVDQRPVISACKPETGRASWRVGWRNEVRETGED